MDYNIYIHNLGGGGGGLSSKTTPFSNRSNDENPSNSFASSVSNVFKAIESVSNGSIGSQMLGQGISTLTKVFPWVAVAILAAKLTDKVITAVGNYQATYQGNYSFQMGYNNVKTTLGNIINPIGMAKNMIIGQLNMVKQNKEIEQQKVLTATSIINIKNRGI